MSLPIQLYERDQILQACLTVFARNGYKNTSTEMLADAAGISKALIFHHFTSKKKLYLSLVDHCFEKVRSGIHYNEWTEHTDFFAAITQLSRAKLDYFREHSDEWKLVYEAFYATPDGLKEEIGDKYGQVSEARHAMLVQLFDKVQLREGVNRKYAFELVMAITRHFETKFLKETTGMSPIDEAYTRSLMEELEAFCDMIRYGMEN
ncbi:TetR/AcrR family transcriptional regulator [Paenibacillus sp. XY044]|uniref:TetR/AcrR family transcriptional regulator n=1 Tax=Paenibacillus sp. XY044 TaxID=2026089 RepID=UPI00211B57F6|nr:TetR/AcrR family transcriptional regulator [Paenibacillus sp. XY044]